MSKSFKHALHKIYRELSADIAEHFKFPLEDINDDLFSPVLIAAYAKCFEFNFDISKQRSLGNSLYLMSFLRGVCEDLITLKFINRLDVKKRHDLMAIYVPYLLETSIFSQQQYFAHQKIDQIIIRRKDDRLIKKLESDLKQFWTNLGYKKDRIFPSVESMAIDGNLKQLYDFLYHATSRTVHFSPNILLRTGWYDEKAMITFSPKNFQKYYSFFNLYQGTNLFIQFSSTFKKQLNLKKETIKKINELEEILKAANRVPELVTFEEMNIEPPNNIELHVMKKIANMNDDEKRGFFDNLPELATFLESKRSKKDQEIAKILRKIERNLHTRR